MLEGDGMLEAQGLQVRVGGYTILRGVDLRLNPGSIVGLVGHNGAGKTTTLRALMGLVPLAAGTVRLDGQLLNDVSPQQRARLGIGYMPEDRRLVGPLTVEENLLVPVWAMGLKDGHLRLGRVYRMVPELAALARRTARELSGGQQKMVALARAFIAGRRVLLLDEPFEGVAPGLAQRLAEVVRGFRSEAVSVFVAESDPNRLESLAETIYTMERGEIGLKRAAEGTG